MLSAEDIYKRVAPSVFIVESFDRSGAVITRGSAVAISPDSVVTNHHVTQQGVSWKLKRGDELWSATITHDDPVHDISELRATRLKTRPVDVAPLSNVQIGGRVYAVGAPAGLELSISEGIVSGIRHLPTGDLIQMTAPISKGSSGGGNGSAIVSGLPYLHQALLAFGHPGGLTVTLIDPDTVSETNCVRQPFCRTEIGFPKAIVLAHRINLFWGLNWQGMQTTIQQLKKGSDVDFVIGCVDTGRRGAPSINGS